MPVRGAIGAMFSRRALLLAGAATAAAGWLGRGLAETPPDDADALASRLAGIRAIREVKRVQHAWAQYAEAGQWRDMAALMAQGGVVVTPTGDVRGRDAIHAHLRETMGGGKDGLAADRLNVRLFLAPVVNLGADGRTAKARWHEMALTGHYGESAEWAGGIHENDCVMEDGVWKIARLHYHPEFAGPYATGWRNTAAETPLVPFHYTPAEAGTPVPPRLAASAPRANLAALDAEAELLLAAGAAQNLQAAYGFYVNRKMWDDVADLFAPGGTMAVGSRTARGRAAILAELKRAGPAGLRQGELNDHLQMVPVVTVAADGRSASLRGIELGMTGQHGGASWWSVAIYDNRFVRGADGRWTIEQMRIIPRLTAAYDAGWARDLPPDAAGYPKTAAPPVRLAPTLAPPARRRSRGSPAEVARKLATAAAHDGAENVSCAYGYYIDEFRWDDVADLFAADGWKELSYIGTYIGRERIRQSLFSRYGRNGRSLVSLAIHQKTQPYVTVAPDGGRAQVRLALFQVNSSVANAGSYIGGVYENQVKLEDGVWKIHGMDLDYVWLANYKGGWAAVEPGANRRFAPSADAIAKYPPDGPLRGVAFAPYPDIAVSGFHFRNPVSGRAPELLLSWSDGRRS